MVDDALQEVAGHAGTVEHGVDADEGEHGVVAAEGETAPPRAADAAAPGDRDPQARAEEAAVDVRVDRGEVVDAAARHEGRHLAGRLAHAVHVRVHEAPHLAARGAALAPDVAGERGDHRVGRVQEHAVQPQQQAARLALERQQHRAVVGEDEPQRLARLARERRLERRLVPAGRLLERELELPCGAHAKPVAMRMAQRRPLVKRRTRLAASAPGLHSGQAAAPRTGNGLRTQRDSLPRSERGSKGVRRRTPFLKNDAARSTGCPCPCRGSASGGRPCPRGS